MTDAERLLAEILRDASFEFRKKKRKTRKKKAAGSLHYDGVVLLRGSGRPVDSSTLSEVDKTAVSPPARKENGNGYLAQVAVRDAAGVVRIIEAGDILTVEAVNGFVAIRTAAGRFVRRQSLASFTGRLDPRQFREAYASILVNISRIVRIEEREAILSDGSRVPVSKAGRARLENSLRVESTAD